MGPRNRPSRRYRRIQPRAAGGPIGARLKGDPRDGEPDHHLRPRTKFTVALMALTTSRSTWRPSASRSPAPVASPLGDHRRVIPCRSRRSSTAWDSSRGDRHVVGPRFPRHPGRACHSTLAMADESRGAPAHLRDIIGRPSREVLSDLSGSFAACSTRGPTDWLNGLMLVTVLQLTAESAGTYTFEHVVDDSSKSIPLTSRSARRRPG